MGNCTLRASKRSMLGKKVRFLRRQGITPANLFGHEVELLALQCDTGELQRIIAQAGMIQPIQLNIAGDKQDRNVLIKEIQRDTLTGMLLNVSFYQTREGKKAEADATTAPVPESTIIRETADVVTLETAEEPAPHAEVDLDLSKVKEVVYIDIDDLGIDVWNIRQGVWDCDEELIDSIRNMGIIEPLIVRPTLLGIDKKYGIVSGSRRYNAAVEAGLDKVPCLVRRLTDMEAMKLSMIENRMRKDTPGWMDVEYVGMMYQAYLINESLSYSDAVEKISRTGIGKPTVERYIRIFNLPTEIKGLLREPNERTTRQKEYLKQFQWRETDKTLPIGHAELLTGLNDLSLNRQMQVALFISNKPFEVASKIVHSVKIGPDKDINDIYDEIRGEYGTIERVIRLDKETDKALGHACMDRQVRWEELINRIIKRWLKSHGYLDGR